MPAVLAAQLQQVLVVECKNTAAISDRVGRAVELVLHRPHDVYAHFVTRAWLWRMRGAGGPREVLSRLRRVARVGASGTECGVAGRGEREERGKTAGIQVFQQE